MAAAIALRGGGRPGAAPRPSAAAPPSPACSSPRRAASAVRAASGRGLARRRGGLDVTAGVVVVGDRTLAPGDAVVENGASTVDARIGGLASTGPRYGCHRTRSKRRTNRTGGQACLASRLARAARRRPRRRVVGRCAPRSSTVRSASPSGWGPRGDLVEIERRRPCRPRSSRSTARLALLAARPTPGWLTAAGCATGGSLRPVGPGLLRPHPRRPGPPDGRRAAARRGCVVPVTARRSALDAPLVDRLLALGVRALDTLVPAGAASASASSPGPASAIEPAVDGHPRHGSRVTVVALVGERGREVREFLEHDLGPEGLARAVVVSRPRTAAAGAPAAPVRRDPHRRVLPRRPASDVLLMMDQPDPRGHGSARSALSAGEPPATAATRRRTFAMLPQLLERAGPGAAGSITGLYTGPGRRRRPQRADRRRRPLDPGRPRGAGLPAGRRNRPNIDAPRRSPGSPPAVPPPRSEPRMPTRLRTVMAAAARTPDPPGGGRHVPGTNPARRPQRSRTGSRTTRSPPGPADRRRAQDSWDWSPRWPPPLGVTS